MMARVRQRFLPLLRGGGCAPKGEASRFQDRLLAELPLTASTCSELKALRATHVQGGRSPPLVQLLAWAACVPLKRQVFKALRAPEEDRLFSVKGTGFSATTRQGSLAKPMANTSAMGTL